MTLRMASGLTPQDANAAAQVPRLRRCFGDPVRILALHGRGGSGTSFRKTVSPLAEALEVAAAPAEVSWTFPSSPFDDGSWWNLPEGARSFNANSYGGFNESANTVAQALLEGEHDVILGHSQGAILASALFADDAFWSREGAPPRPRGAVLNGVAWPNPYGHLLDATGGEGDAVTKMMFVIGERDSVNPPEGADRVRESFRKRGVDVISVKHGGKHSMPVYDEVAMGKIVRFILDVCRHEEDGNSI